MMNISSKGNSEMEYPLMVSPLDYREVSISTAEAGVEAEAERASAAKGDVCISPGFSQEEVSALLENARAEAVRETEETLRREFDRKLNQSREQLLHALEDFSESRREYFFKVEAEVIQLSLGIAEKILQRESSADPMLVAAMVRIELDKIHADSQVRLKVPEGDVNIWKSAISSLPRGIQVDVVGDAHLTMGDCILQADAGAVDLGIRAQLKNVEQSFLDLLTKRPSQ